MRAANKTLPLLLITALVGCGQQLVEFPNPAIPQVVSTDPANSSTGIGVSRTVNATFNEQIDPSTLNTQTFTLLQGTTPIPGTVQYTGLTATFAPSTDLAFATLYTASLSTGVRSVAANEVSLASSYTWSFTTAQSTAAPVITTTTPGNGSTGVNPNQSITATFNTAMNPATLNDQTFSLQQGAASVTGTISYSGTTATFTPAAPLAVDLVYTATVTTGAQNTVGVGLASNDSWTFTTAPPAPLAPMVTVVDPQGSALGVALNTSVRAAFNEPMHCTTLTSATFTVTASTAAVPGVVSCSGNTATFTPTNPLAPGTNYSATIVGGAEGVKDPAGNAMATSFNWSFTTVENQAPLVASTSPENGAIGICPNAVIQATFDSAMAPASFSAETFTLTTANNPVSGAISYNTANHTASFTPSSDLTTATNYVATLTTGITDNEGNPLANNVVWRFATGPTLCQAPVQLNSLSTFVAVAGAGLTNSNSGGTTTLNGNVGLSPTATCLGDGSPCSATDPVINGTLYANDPAGVAAAAKLDLTNAYNDAAGRPSGTVVNDLSGLTLAPGVYTSGSTMSIAVNGTLVLDALGDPNGVWIFQVGSSLTINGGAKLLLVNGANASNVFWAVFASSTLGNNVSFAGNVLAGSSNSVGTGSTVVGRLLCRTGQITLLSDTINLPGP